MTHCFKVQYKSLTLPISVSGSVGRSVIDSFSMLLSDFGDS